MGDTDHAREQAGAQLDSISELVKALETAREHGEAVLFGDTVDADRAEEAIWEDAFSVEVRSGWYSPGGDSEPSEYTILLCTGGPACRIIGELDEWCQPDTVRLEYQDWFVPWESYPLDAGEREALLVYANQFYYGE